MIRLIIKRILLLIPLLVGLSVLIFAWVRVLPGGPAAALAGQQATAEQVAQIAEELGLNKPILEQYGVFLNNVIHLDFGVSTQTARPVTEELLQRFPASIELALSSMIIALIVGIPLGYFAARKHDTWMDNVSVVGSLIGVTVPVFFLAFVLKYIFAVQLNWLPPSGRLNPRIITEHPTGFYVLDGLVTGNWNVMLDAMAHLALPALALSTIPLAIITRIARASVLEVLHADYVRTAEAKGLKRRIIAFRHVLRNAMIPVVTITGLLLGGLVSATVLTESVFAFPGVGRFIADAVLQRDYAVIQGFVVIIGCAYAVINLIVDLLYGILDPRVRY